MNDPTSATPFPEARILVVDDEKQVRSVLVRFLNLLGYHADEAASGHEALQMLERTLYDVAVLDIVMPGMDGVEVMHRARRMRPGLAIVFLTAHATLESAIAAVRSRAVDYLLKPIKISDLAVAIATALQQRIQGEWPRVSTPGRFLEAGSLTLDQERRLAIVAEAGAADSFNVRLTRAETGLLACLMQHPGIALSCRELALAALGYDASDEEAQSLVRPHISRLRNKIEPDPARPQLILTVPTKCYLFNP